MVGGAIAHLAATPACRDDYGQGTGHETFASSGYSESRFFS
jgi:hypothetical protein